MKVRFFLVWIYGIALSSCVSTKISTNDFFSVANHTELNGTYLDRDRKLSELLHIDSDLAYFITFEFYKKDSLKLTYPTESGFESVYYKGKFKKNFFEIYFKNTRIYIPFFSMVWIDRIRIGCDIKSNLLIQHWDERLGWLLIMAAGGSTEDEYLFQNRINVELFPYTTENKWGFVDRKQNIVITPQYESIELFRDTVTKVKQNNKWGLINNRGEILAETKYDTIYSFNSDAMAKILLNDKEGYLNKSGEEVIPPIYEKCYYITDDNLVRIILNGKEGYLDKRGNEIISPIYETCYLASGNLIKIVLNGREGYLDKNGETVIPPVYDMIDYFSESSSIVRIFEGGKYGYRTRTDILCPPIFEEASSEFSTDICPYLKKNAIRYAKVKYKNEHYLLNEEGYMYKYKCVNTIRKFYLYEESKIKVSDLDLE